MKIKILTDTAADLSKDEIEKFGIDIINMPVSFDGEDFIGDTDAFWEKLLSGKVARTSQPSPDAIRAHFQKAKDENDELICIFISSKFSGTYESALNIKEEIGYENIHIIDSMNASVSEKLIVFKACKLRDAGASAAEIVEKLEKFKKRVRLFACLDTLKYLLRGGRISKAAFNLGTVLNIKPIITFVDGAIHTCFKAFGTQLAAIHLAERVKGMKIDTDYPVCPIYANTDKNCRNFIEKAEKRKIPVNREMLMPIGSTIGTHIGPNAFGIVFVEQE